MKRVFGLFMLALAVKAEATNQNVPRPHQSKILNRLFNTYYVLPFVFSRRNGAIAAKWVSAACARTAQEAISLSRQIEQASFSAAIFQRRAERLHCIGRH